MTARTASPPGIAPLDVADWLFDDADLDGQLILKHTILYGMFEPKDTLAKAWNGVDLGPAAIILDAPAQAAAEELRDAALASAAAAGLGRRDGDVWRRRDGGEVRLDADPMSVAGAVAAEDWLIMERREGWEEHALTAGSLCFPAHWRLEEKIGKAMLRIHLPVPSYAGDLSRRVQRFFDGVQAGRPLWRANWHFAGGPQIITPMSENDKTGLYQERLPDVEVAAWLRVERQTVLRLPRTGAVVFGVRTLMSDVDGFSPEQWRGLHATLSAMSPEDRLGKAPASLFERAAAEAERPIDA